MEYGLSFKNSIGIESISFATKASWKLTTNFVLNDEREDAKPTTAAIAEPAAKNFRISFHRNDGECSFVDVVGTTTFGIFFLFLERPMTCVLEAYGDVSFR